jgi:predicted GNAT family acetyltransferase
MSRTRVWDDVENHRFVIEVDGEQAGLAVYHLRGGRYLFVHTEVDDAFAGKGVGTTLVEQSLQQVRDLGAQIVPLCPFYIAYLERHPEQTDLVDHELLARINSKR